MKRLLVGGRRADFPVRPGLAERRGAGAACPGIHHARMVSPGRRHGCPDRRDHRPAARRAACRWCAAAASPRTCRAIERLTVAEAFARHAGAGLAGNRRGRRRIGRCRRAPGCATARTGRTCFSGCCWSGSSRISAAAHPTFLTHWPAAQAALARRDPADPRVAERFELFVCGIELANAFVELTDPAEQRARFEADRRRRQACAGRAGRWMRISSPPWRTACRQPPASRSVSIGWPCWRRAPIGLGRSCGCRRRISRSASAPASPLRHGPATPGEVKLRRRLIDINDPGASGR